MARRALFIAVSALLVSSRAGATVTEPNGTVVPLDSMNGETQLYTLFQQQGESIDWQADAHDTPDVFSPLCGFTATFVLHQAGLSLGVGWYNADPNATQPPPDADIHLIINPGDPVGKMVTSSDIKSDPSYKGGLIGFALVGSQTHYSEKKWNVVCSGCSNPGPWILSVSYQSKKDPNSYYLCFEDGSVDANGFGNDGDFNDDVFLFTGITCSGGGVACDTGKPGLCANGVTECEGAGTTSCQPLVSPQPETCNALDDDCDGKVDGDGLCPGSQICFHGTCVPKCGSGEFICPSGTTCNANGVCVDPKCASVQCPAGQVCSGGVCKGACDGITCPVGQTCSGGNCVDPCAGKSCPMGQVCEGGACVPTCDCSPCGQGKGCDAASGKCVETACVGVACSGGQVCSAGSCVDPCGGAKCPSGQACKGGSCVDVPASGGNGGAGGLVLGGGGKAGTSGGAAGHGASGGATNAGGSSAGGSGGSGGKVLVVGGDAVESSPSEGGCGCRVGGNGPRFGFAAGLLGVAALLLRRARRR